NVERLNPRPQKGSRRGPWPELRITHATLRVVDTPARSVELNDLSLTGRPVRHGGGEWDGQVDVPGYGQADVRVAPGGEHEVAFDYDGIDAWARVWWPELEGSPGTRLRGR